MFIRTYVPGLPAWVLNLPTLLQYTVQCSVHKLYSSIIIEIAVLLSIGLHQDLLCFKRAVAGCNAPLRYSFACKENEEEDKWYVM